MVDIGNDPEISNVLLIHVFLLYFFKPFLQFSLILIPLKNKEVTQCPKLSLSLPFFSFGWLSIFFILTFLRVCKSGAENGRYCHQIWVHHKKLVECLTPQSWLSPFLPTTSDIRAGDLAERSYSYSNKNSFQEGIIIQITDPGEHNCSQGYQVFMQLLL